MTETALGPFQFEYRGLIFGEGTQYYLDSEVAGLGLVETRAGDRILPRGHGAIQGLDWVEPRVITLPFQVFSEPDPAVLPERVTTLIQTFRVTPDVENWLRFRTNIGTFRVRGRTTRTNTIIDPITSSQGRRRFRAEIRCADPRYYGDEVKQTNLEPSTVAERGGFDLPVDLPLDMAPMVLTTNDLVNDGNADAWPVVSILNPNPTAISNIQIQTSDGQTFTMATTLAQNQTLRLDFDAYVRARPGPYVAIDGASRFGDWVAPRNPLYIPPGTSAWDIVTDATPAQPTTLVQWRDTYF